MITIKLLGSVFIIISSTMIGLEHSKKYSRRLNNLKHLQNCIQMLETEIVYSSSQLPHALESIYIKGNIKVSFLFNNIKEYLIENKDKSLFESFKHNIEKSKDELFLDNDDAEIILSLGRILGASDVTDQQKHFKTAIMNLEINQSDAREKKDKNEKMYRSLGVLFGVAVVLILY